MYYLIKSLGYNNVTVDIKNNNPEIYTIRLLHGKFRKNPISVRRIIELPEISYETFVYDIETTKGTFLGGVGSLNPSNTDSIYSAMPEKYFYEIE